jgi:hypothetical protein
MYDIVMLGIPPIVRIATLPQTIDAPAQMNPLI